MVALPQPGDSEATLWRLVDKEFLEERDLVAQHGDPYRDYQRRVPMLLPWPKGRA